MTNGPYPDLRIWSVVERAQQVEIALAQAQAEIERLERRVRDADARKALVMRAAEMLLGNVAFQVFQDRGFRACADQLRAVLVSESPEKKP